MADWGVMARIENLVAGIVIRTQCWNNIMTLNIRNAIIVVFTPVLSIQFVSTDAQAQTVADNMTCQQAINYYEKNGRISKYTNGKNVIPIYSGVPVSKMKQLECTSEGIRFKTTDNPRCMVAYKCVHTPRS
jgi:hypothetical protein